MNSAPENVNEEIYSPEIKNHLTKVYLCVGVSTLMASVTAWIGVMCPALGFSSFGLIQALTVGLGSLCILIGLMVAHVKRASLQLRLSLMIAFATISGLGLVPLLTLALDINPMVILTALASTVIIFISFTVVALLAPRRIFLFLLGPILAMTFYMIFLLILSSFYAEIFPAAIKTYLYLGLIVACLFILYDTQFIIERHLQGDEDYVFHAVLLFIDLIHLFRHLLIILSESEIDNSGDNSDD